MSDMLELCSHCEQLLFMQPGGTAACNDKSRFSFVGQRLTRELSGSQCISRQGAMESRKREPSPGHHLAEFVEGRPEVEDVPHHGFRVGLDHQFQKKGKPFTVPRLHQLPAFIGLSLRSVGAKGMLCDVSCHPPTH